MQRRALVEVRARHAMLRSYCRCFWLAMPASAVRATALKSSSDRWLALACWSTPCRLDDGYMRRREDRDHSLGKTLPWISPGSDLSFGLKETKCVRSGHRANAGAANGYELRGEARAAPSRPQGKVACAKLL